MLRVGISRQFNTAAVACGLKQDRKELWDLPKIIQQIKINSKDEK